VGVIERRGVRALCDAKGFLGGVLVALLALALVLGRVPHLRGLLRWIAANYGRGRRRACGAPLLWGWHEQQPETKECGQSDSDNRLEVAAEWAFGFDRVGR
jgi:hypothetical protein